MAFPTTPVIDNFNRTNEGPPLSGSWSAFHVSWGFVDSHKVVSNAGVAAVDDFCGSYWSAATFGPDCEVYVTVNARPPNGFGIPLRLRIVGGDGALGSSSHYYANIARDDSGGDLLAIIRNDGGVETELASSNGDITIGAGDSFGFERVGDDLTIYYKASGGSWVSKLTVTDATPLSQVAGNIGIQTETNSFSFDDFGGGTISGGPTAPTAEFSGTPLSGPAPLTVDFTDLSTGDPTSWAWDFGDGDTSIEQNPTHEYADPGTYTVALTATNDTGSDTETKVDYITVYGPPVVDFSGTPTSGLVSLSVDFTDLSTNDPSSWSWDFGDGGSSTSQNPTHVYNYIGVYTVTLTASSSAGSDTETKIDYITVTDVDEFGAAEVENCDLDTGGASVGLRVANVVIARDNILGSLTVDASAELRAKDNAYSTLVNNGTLTSLAGDRAVFDALGYQARHANDIDDAGGIHWTKTELDGAYLAIGAAAGGDLSGTYPNPSVNDDSHSHTEATISLSDVTTDDATTSAHGFLPKLSGAASQYLGGDGTFHELPTTLSFFLDDTASDIGGYKTLSPTVPVGGEANVSASITGAAVAIEEFALAANQFDFISGQVLHVHIHAEKTAGTKGVNIFARVYHRTSGGTETLLGTSENTPTITSKTDYDLHVSVTDTAFAATDRLVLKFLGNQTGAGTDPTAVIYYQGTTLSRIEVGAAPIGTGGTDANAIHDNVAGEIHAITEKVSPVDADEIIIEDSADSYNKKRVQIVNLPTGSAGALDDLTDVTITTPSDGDVLTYDSGSGDWINAPATGGIGGSTGATDNAVSRADGTGGATLQNSLMTIDDSGTPNIPSGQTYNINNAPHTHSSSSISGATDFLVVQVFS